MVFVSGKGKIILTGIYYIALSTFGNFVTIICLLDSYRCGFPFSLYVWFAGYGSIGCLLLSSAFVDEKDSSVILKSAIFNNAFFTLALFIIFWRAVLDIGFLIFVFLTSIPMVFVSAILLHPYNYEKPNNIKISEKIWKYIPYFLPTVFLVVIETLSVKYYTSLVPLSSGILFYFAYLSVAFGFFIVMAKVRKNKYD